MNLGCILLGAGNSVRFGENKLMYELGGKPMAFYALELHGRMEYAVRVLVTQPSFAALWEKAEQCGFRVAANRDPSRGIGSSVRIGMRVLLLSGARTDGVLFGVCDQPYVTSATLEKLIQTFTQNPDRIVALSFGGRRGNPVIFPAAYYAELMSVSGDTGGGQVVAKHPEALLLVEAASGNELADIDTKR